jgi:hypothetical protein
MTQDLDSLAAAAERSRFALSLALSKVALLPLGEDRDSQLNDIATILIGSSEQARAQAIQQCPDLAHAKPIPDAQLHTAEMEKVSRLKVSDIEVIDRTIVANSTHIWQKANRIVGCTLVDLKIAFPEVPLGFYAQRIAALVQGGKLEAQGEIEFMRLCELRLSSLSKSSA